VRLANGGHPPALVLRADGAVEAVETGRGPLVGIVADAEFHETDLELAPDDLLLLYTDGVTEVRTSDLLLGHRKLVATLAGLRGRAAHDVVEAVTGCALRLQQGTARDDIAVLAIRCGPPAAAGEAASADAP
jgi:sigma-B regulation protein RsbU (phosphoserine phosphatase)